MLEPRHLSEQMIAERLAEALRRRMPESNRRGWLWQLADEIGVDEDDVAGWLYCKTPADATAVIKLIARFGSEFANELLSLAGIRCMAANE